MASGPDPFLTPDEFKELSERYFADCIAENEPLTMTGLALAMGFCSRQSIHDYKQKPEYAHLAKRASLMVEHGYEKRLLSEGAAAGPIFALKNCGWKDRADEEHDPTEKLSMALESLADKLQGG